MTQETKRRLNNVLRDVLCQIKDKNKQQEIKSEFQELLVLVEKKTKCNKYL